MPGGLAPLLTVESAFHARVVAARLGADGIPVQLTGAVDGPYPMGSTTLWVLAADLDDARGLLLVDEAEAVLADADGALDAWADEVAALTPLARARRAGVPVLLAAPLVGAAVASLIFKIG